ncbi:hypothetical protein HMI54_001630 [Coelomomyces lativittatus]|nr:hypothetical protein HMI54_001630 [Coelomomyces lativittatus]
MFSLILGGWSSITELSTQNFTVVKYPSVQVTLGYHRISLTLIDTPGISDDEKSLNACMQYIENQFEFHLQEELKVNRNPLAADSMVHMVLYLLPPGPLSELDLVAMQALQKRTNVLPLLSRVDTITEKQLSKIKDQLQKSLRGFQPLKFLDMVSESDGDDEDSAFEEELNLLKTKIPMAVVGAEFNDDDPFIRLQDDVPLARVFSWGTLDIEDTNHCDLSWIKYLLLDFGIDYLRNSVRVGLYEQYRTDRLSTLH